jgi:hypothetical protein
MEVLAKVGEFWQRACSRAKILLWLVASEQSGIATAAATAGEVVHAALPSSAGMKVSILAFRQ